VKDVIEGHNYLITRNVARTIRSSVFNQIVKTINAMGLAKQFSITQDSMTITCKKNNKQILFAGLDDVEKLKSVTPIDGVITDIWIEEATETAYEAYKQLTKRLRGKTDNNIPKRMILSFNPVLQTHWIYREFFGKWDDSKRIYRDKKLLILKTTYKDNKFLTRDDIDALESETDSYFYNVYTLGNWGVLGNLVFKNWRTEDLGSKIASFDKIYNGLDFGFSADPNALVRLHVDQARKQMFIFDELYKCEMQDDELAEELKSRLGTQYVTCDCAEPKSIADLNRRGVRAIPARKGPDSINFGIRFLQGYEIIVDIRCQNFKNEIQAYHWAEDKYGNALRKPVDKDNHLMDALRYATEELQLAATAQATSRLR
jgi:phage terminase large subunit